MSKQLQFSLKGVAGEYHRIFQLSRFFGTLTFFRIINVFFEILTTTEFFICVRIGICVRTHIYMYEFISCKCTATAFLQVAGESDSTMIIAKRPRSEPTKAHPRPTKAHPPSAILMQRHRLVEGPTPP